MCYLPFSININESYFLQHFLCTCGVDFTILIELELLLKAYSYHPWCEQLLRLQQGMVLSSVHNRSSLFEHNLSYPQSQIMQNVS